MPMGVRPLLRYHFVIETSRARGSKSSAMARNNGSPCITRSQNTRIYDRVNPLIIGLTKKTWRYFCAVHPCGALCLLTVMFLLAKTILLDVYTLRSLALHARKLEILRL
ncbi:hypothetical protein SCHPADRAFT_233893 [Schizopora paradoxa]|uniref:Uncharacterized protein n=1 Tax=Schizopora paradoxa TaxID=27342 RepID=A0A0H2S2T9_9AGAM|nr:hypothetical protein SCHPADRAFT_233893 [Schizopora paradoxa]